MTRSRIHTGGTGCPPQSIRSTRSERYAGYALRATRKLSSLGGIFKGFLFTIVKYVFVNLFYGNYYTYKLFYFKYKTMIM